MKIDFQKMLERLVADNEKEEKKPIVFPTHKLARTSTLVMPDINTTVEVDNFLTADKILLKEELLKHFSLTGHIIFRNIKSGFKDILIDNCLEEILVSYDYSNGVENKSVRYFEIVHQDYQREHKIRYLYDNNLDLECINYQRRKNGDFYPGIDVVFEPDDEYMNVIIKANILNESIVADILPEFIVPSAYKFDEGLKQRIDVFKMMFF